MKRSIGSSLSLVAAIVTAACSGTSMDPGPAKPTTSVVTASPSSSPSKSFDPLCENKVLPAQGAGLGRGGVGCADAVIRITVTADNAKATHKYEISTDGNNWNPYIEDSRSPVTIRSEFWDGCDERGDGCGNLWHFTVTHDERVAKTLAVCKVSTAVNQICTDQGSPEFLGNSYTRWLAYELRRDVLLIYINYTDK